MKTFTEYQTIVTGEREPRANHHTLLSCVLPRPIAFVSTVSPEGVPNLAPFSFFNAVGSSPPAIIFSPATRANNTDKDTLNNIKATGEFVVQVVTHDIKEAMNQASANYPTGVNEFEQAGFTQVPSVHVKPPRVGESPVQMECKLVQVVKVGDGPLSANIVIGHVLCFHVADGYLLENGTVDVEKVDLVGRMGGDWYSTIRDRFELGKPGPV